MRTEGRLWSLGRLYLVMWHWSCPTVAKRAIWCHISSIVKPRLKLLELRSQQERACMYNNCFSGSSRLARCVACL